MMELTLLEICNNIAISLRFPAMQTIIANEDKNVRMIFHAVDLAMRRDVVGYHPWALLRRSEVVRTSYDASAFPTPSDFGNIINDTPKDARHRGTPAIGPLVPTEWAEFKSQNEAAEVAPPSSILYEYTTDRYPSDGGLHITYGSLGEATVTMNIMDSNGGNQYSELVKVEESDFLSVVNADESKRVDVIVESSEYLVIGVGPYVSVFDFAGQIKNQIGELFDQDEVVTLIIQKAAAAVDIHNPVVFIIAGSELDGAVLSASSAETVNLTPYIHIWPPPNILQEQFDFLSYMYVTKLIVNSSLGELKQGFDNDTDAPVMHSRLVEQAGLVRCLRSLGLSYGDEKLELVEELKKEAQRDGGRTKMSVGGTRGRGLLAVSRGHMSTRRGWGRRFF